MKQRIWELDALRGLCVLGMILIHFVYDLVVLYGLVSWDAPPWFHFIQSWGGILFLLLSGICVTLGSHPIKRGLAVLACGMLCTLATWGMYALRLADKDIIIYFGVLHCLGVCMLLWPLFQKLPVWLLGVLGGLISGIGLYFLARVQVSTPWLAPLGLLSPDFVSSDYFPLLPHLGFFLLGAVAGKTLYREKRTLFPRVDPSSRAVAFLRSFGKHSLPIYLLHQPLFSLFFFLLSQMRSK